jgi:hypothetical protein
MLRPLDELFDLVAPSLREQLAWLRAEFPAALEPERVNAPAADVEECHKDMARRRMYQAREALAMSQAQLELDLAEQRYIEQRRYHSEPPRKGFEALEDRSQVRATAPTRKTDYVDSRGRYYSPLRGAWVDEDGQVLKTERDAYRFPTDLPR